MRDLFPSWMLREGVLEVCEQCAAHDCVMPQAAYFAGEPAICCVCDPSGWPASWAGEA